MANTLTAIRLLLALPVAVALAHPTFATPSVAALLLAMAIATDYLDGPVARRMGTASPAGMLFDHTTDCLFVTAGLSGAALAGSITPILPALIPFAFGQYVVDSYVWSRRRQLRASFLGRWNGIFYFVPLVLITVARLPVPSQLASVLNQAAGALGYLLAASTVASMIDRATTPARPVDTDGMSGQRTSV
jgi:phosphatidylglycerophosphate synthase